MKNRKLLTLVITVVCVFTTYAQGPPPPPPPGLAIDGGFIFLLLAGLFYGIKKVKD